MPNLRDILQEPGIVAALKQAWQDSHPGIAGGHEEGGFIVEEPNGRLKVIRWPQGGGNSIVLPPHAGCKIEKLDIIASFHTHPNAAEHYLQEPSETDKHAVRDDPDLKGKSYQGELVVAQAMV